MKKKKTKKIKKPFGNYTIEQIFAFEAATYFIVAGVDVFDIKGNFFFDRNGASKYYNKILREVMGQMHAGTKKQRNNARRVLEGLRVEPLRIH